MARHFVAIMIALLLSEAAGLTPVKSWLISGKHSHSLRRAVASALVGTMLSVIANTESEAYASPLPLFLNDEAKWTDKELLHPNVQRWNVFKRLDLIEENMFTKQDAEQMFARFDARQDALYAKQNSRNQIMVLICSFFSLYQAYVKK